jgi:hypothetical protein
MLESRCPLKTAQRAHHDIRTDRAGERLKRRNSRLPRNSFLVGAGVLHLAAGAITGRGRDGTIRTAAWGFDSRLRLRCPAAETDMQRKHKRKHCEYSLLHHFEATRSCISAQGSSDPDACSAIVRCVAGCNRCLSGCNNENCLTVEHMLDAPASNSTY